MSVIEITKGNALKAYKWASKEGKELLENLIGKDLLVDIPNNKLPKWEMVCERAGIDPVSSLPYPDPKNGEERFLNACKKISVISRVFREGKKHDWTNSSKGKYYPWWSMSSGSGLSYNGYVNACTLTAVGSRLCFFSREDVEFVAKHYPEVYHDLMTEED